jgi:FkbH-like protein
MASDSINIALLGNFTTEYLGQYLEEQCIKNDLSPKIYNSPFNQYSQEALSPHSGLYAGKPDLIILFLEGELLFPEWYEFKTMQKSGREKEELAGEVFRQISGVAEAIRQTTDAKIIINNFRIPYHSPLGILDTKFTPGLKRLISDLNANLEKWAGAQEYTYIFDYNGFCAHCGHMKALDRRLLYSAGSPLSLPFARMLAAEYLRYILPIKSRNKKCLVLDLDNTLWGGIAGEDGLSGVKLDLTGPGKSFYDFQKEILNLYERGILLAVNSKNNPEDALEIMENHPYMLLRKKHFSALRINWQDKAVNMEEIAEELNIGTDSLVFFDDSPVERENVRLSLPCVKVVDVPADSSKFSDTLRSLAEFEALGITQEDVRRNELVGFNKKREEVRKQFGELGAYLDSLGTRITVEYAHPFTIPRITQLLQKTNQFNMTTIRYQQPEVAKMAASDRFLVLSCSASDRFGDLGIIGVFIAETDNGEAVIDSYLLSCRALGRNIEYAFLNAAVAVLRERGIKHIRSGYLKTARNTANENFYKNAGFLEESSDEKGKYYFLPEHADPISFKNIDVNIRLQEANDGQRIYSTYS